MTNLLTRPATGRPHIIAHRGARSLAPENTVPAIRRALSMDVQGIEFDIDVSADGVPVVVHQETLQPDKTGRQLELALADVTRAWTMRMSAAEIGRIDAGSWFGREFGEVRIPLLQDVFALPWGQTYAVAELKDPFFWENKKNRDSAPRILNAVSTHVKRFFAEGANLCLLSFSPHILELCQRDLQVIPRILAVWTDQRGMIGQVLDDVKRLAVTAVTLADIMVVEDPSWVTRLHEAGCQVWVYDVTPDNLDSFREWLPEKREKVWREVARLGVDGIESDFPLEVQAILRQG